MIVQVHGVFYNDFAKNVIIHGVDNSSSSHSDNNKNNFLVLEEGSTDGINRSFGSPNKKFNINFTKGNKNFVWVCFVMLLIVCGKEIFKFKVDNKNMNSQIIFVSEVFLMDLVLQSLENYL